MKDSEVRMDMQISLTQLETKLSMAGIDFSGWGHIQGSKPIGKLLREINEGDCSLTFDAKGNLVRQVEQVGVFVFARDDEGQLLRLREDRQEFTDGRVRSRDMQGVSYREKVIASQEGFNRAAVRGMREELPDIYSVYAQRDPGMLSNPLLGIDSFRPPRILVEGENNYVPSYPGLPNRSYEQRYALIIDQEAYKPEGYVTEEEDKTTYFLWESVSPDHPCLPATAWQKMNNDQMLSVIAGMKPRITHSLGVRPEIAAEYFFLAERSQALQAYNDLEIGTPLELEYTATTFRMLDLERAYPALKMYI